MRLLHLRIILLLSAARDHFPTEHTLLSTSVPALKDFTSLPIKYIIRTNRLRQQLARAVIAFLARLLLFRVFLEWVAYRPGERRAYAP